VTDITEFSTEAKDACTCGNFIGAKLCCLLLDIFAYVAGNDPSFTAFADEGGGAELWPLDTTPTGVDAAKIQLELIEFQENVVAVKELFFMAHLKTSWHTWWKSEKQI